MRQRRTRTRFHTIGEDELKVIGIRGLRKTAFGVRPHSLTGPMMTTKNAKTARSMTVNNASIPLVKTIQSVSPLLRIRVHGLAQRNVMLTEFFSPRASFQRKRAQGTSTKGRWGDIDTWSRAAFERCQCGV